MRNLPALPTWLRILMLGILAGLLNLSPLPHDLRAAWEQAGKAFRNNTPASAAAALAKALAYEPWRQELWLARGRYALLAQDYAQAAEALEEAGRRGALSPEDWTALGDAYQALNDLEKAVECWSRALEGGAVAVDIYRRQLTVYEAEKNYDKLLGIYQALTTAQPANGQAHFKAGLIIASRETETALAYLERAAELDAQVAQPARKLAGDIRTASLQEMPAFTLISAGRSLAALGYWDLAKEAFQNTIRLEPGYAEAWAFLAEAQQQVGGAEAGYAWDNLQQALALNPNSLAANLLAALYFQRKGDYSQAESWLQSASRLEPNNPIVQVELGNTYTRLGDLQKAEAAYRKAIELQPEDVALRRALVNFLLSHQIKLRESALPVARQAVILAPEDAAALDLYGETLFLLGDLYGAKRFLERAVHADPAYAPALMHLGVTLVYLGEGEPGKRMLEAARRLAVDLPTRTQAERLLQYYFP